ncbi:hypothetical protein WJX72_009157 [[Myrmecia] bisecta]|uniref:non-specific serine/threonine protein kinase n=1 Tax=[Myrmecia] bisecta TaxID=41462 RepID=A0AAW1Q201_9CHLO
MLSGFNHANIIQYHESILEEGLLHIVMEYADDGDLCTAVQQRSAAKNPMSEAEIMFWFVQILLALWHVHSKNVLHRDLKTQNIFLAKGNILKLGDFGIARVLTSGTDMARTVIGTPYYLSPEICEDKPYDQKSDCWSLGCVLYEMCTLKRAFDGQSLPALVVKILRGKYPPLAERYSVQLRSLVDSMLRQKPKDRPSVEEMLRQPYVLHHVKRYLDYMMRYAAASGLSPVLGATQLLDPCGTGLTVRRSRSRSEDSEADAERAAVRPPVSSPMMLRRRQADAELERQREAVLQERERRKALAAQRANAGAASLGRRAAARQSAAERHRQEAEAMVAERARIAAAVAQRHQEREAEKARQQEEARRRLASHKEGVKAVKPRIDRTNSSHGRAAASASTSGSSTPAAEGRHIREWIRQRKSDIHADPLRFSLEQQLGADKLLAAYRYLKSIQAAEGEHSTQETLEIILGPQMHLARHINRLLLMEDAVLLCGCGNRGSRLCLRGCRRSNPCQESATLQVGWPSQLTRSRLIAHARLLTELVATTPFLSAFNAALAAANLTSVLALGTYTVFAPTNDAFDAALQSANLSCQTDYTVKQPCDSLQAFVAAQNLPTLLRNHVVAGSFPVSRLAPDMALQFLGGAVQQVSISNGVLYIGNAPVIQAGINATNGVLHTLGEALSSNAVFNASSVAVMEQIGGWGPFTDAQRSLLASDAQTSLLGYSSNVTRWFPYPDAGLMTPMPLIFDSTLGKRPKQVAPQPRWNHTLPSNVTRPVDNTTLAFYTVFQQAALIRSGQLTSVELTQMYLQRMRRYANVLENVITFTDELALQQAAAADALLANGTDLGPLHGIPYGLKDLVAVPGYKTTFGAGAFQDLVIDHQAWVYQKLTAAGAVLIAKLAMGEMASGAAWFGGRTKCPWNLAIDASGSSAGPAASSSAGLLSFSIGTETGGSLVSPAARNGITVLRPSHGTIGRSWVMSLGESLDKLGHFCRSAEDCAVIYDAVRGHDPSDPTSQDVEFASPFQMDVSTFSLGYLNSTPPEVLASLSAKGTTLVPIALNWTVDDTALYNIVLNAEAGAHFDYWQRSGLANQNRVQDSWPLRLRRGRITSSIDYVQANRARWILCQQVADLLDGLDAILAGDPGISTNMANLVGLPAMVVPVRFDPLPEAPTSNRKLPVNLHILGQPYGESQVLAVAMAWQSDTTAHLARPPIDNVEPRLLTECTMQYARCTLPGINPPPRTSAFG